MRVLRNAIFALIILGSGAAEAADFLNLSGAQEQLIHRSVRNDKGQAAPSGFRPSVGDKIPSSLILRKLSSRVLNLIPTSRNYRYVKLQNDDILLVDPKDRGVLDVISQ